MYPCESVTTQPKFAPFVFADVIDPAGIISGVPSPTELNVNGPPNNSPPFALQPLALFLITSIGLDKLKQPWIALASMPTSKPVIAPSYAILHTKHVPAPGLSKLTAEGIGGKPKMYPCESVTIHPKFAPFVFADVIDPAGIISGVPSPTELNVNGPPNNSPPFALQPLALFLITSIGLDKLKQPWIAFASIPTSKPVIGPS